MVMAVEQCVNVLNSTELYIEKWLKWQVLCYAYFTKTENIQASKQAKNLITLQMRGITSLISQVRKPRLSDNKKLT